MPLLLLLLALLLTGPATAQGTDRDFAAEALLEEAAEAATREALWAGDDAMRRAVTDAQRTHLRERWACERDAACLRRLLERRVERATTLREIAFENLGQRFLAALDGDPKARQDLAAIPHPLARGYLLYAEGGPGWVRGAGALLGEAGRDLDLSRGQDSLVALRRLADRERASLPCGLMARDRNLHAFQPGPGREATNCARTPTERYRAVIAWPDAAQVAQEIGTGGLRLAVTVACAARCAVLQPITTLRRPDPLPQDVALASPTLTGRFGEARIQFVKTADGDVWLSADGWTLWLKPETRP
jgi:hypothetical protein